MRLLPWVVLATLPMLNSAGCASPRALPVTDSAAPTDFLPEQLEVELALAAGPAHIRADATVYVFGPRGYSKVQSGSNNFICLVNRDGQQRGERALRPTCWDAEGSNTIVPVVLKVGEMLAQGQSAVQIEHAITAGFRQGLYQSPRKTGIAYMLRGDVAYDPQTQHITGTFPAHYMIYAPGVSNADIGMSESAFALNPSLPVVYSGYSGGSHTAYIIIIASESQDHGH